MIVDANKSKITFANQLSNRNTRRVVTHHLSNSLRRNNEESRLQNAEKNNKDESNNNNNNGPLDARASSAIPSSASRNGAEKRQEELLHKASSGIKGEQVPLFRLKSNFSQFRLLLDCEVSLEVLERIEIMEEETPKLD